MQCQGDIFYSSTAIVFFSDAEEYRPHLATSSSRRVGVLGTGEVTEVTSLPYCASICSVFYCIIREHSEGNREVTLSSLLFLVWHHPTLAEPDFYHNMRVPDALEISGSTHPSIGSWCVPTSSRSVTACIFIKSHEGANEALLISEGPDPTTFTPTGDYSCD